MQKLILKSEKTSEELELSFGLLMSTSKLPSEEKVQLLLKQSNASVELLYKHFQKNAIDTLALVKTIDVD